MLKIKCGETIAYSLELEVRTKYSFFTDGYGFINVLQFWEGKYRLQKAFAKTEEPSCNLFIVAKRTMI